MSAGDIQNDTLFQDDASRKSHKPFQLPATLSMGMNEKSLIECPGELKCSETVVIMSGKGFISNFVCSFPDYSDSNSQT